MHARDFSLDAGGMLSPAKFIASPNFDARPRDACIDAVILHAISLPPGSYGGGHVEKLFTNSLDAAAHPYFAEVAALKVSAHFYIDRAGEIVQFVPTHARAWHAGESILHGRARVNDFSLGIELEGCDADAFTEAQYAMLIPLLQFLRARHPHITESRIAGHCDIAPRRKTDPGPHFDWARVRREISAPRPRG